MSRRALELLARLRRHEVDRQRLAAAALAAELRLSREAVTAEEHRLAREHAQAFELPGGPRPLAAFAAASRRRSSALAERCQELEGRLAAAQPELQDAIRAWKSLDLASARSRAVEEAEAARRQRQEIEEAALLRRAGGQNSGASVTSRPSSAGPNLIWQESRELSRTS